LAFGGDGLGKQRRARGRDEKRALEIFVPQRPHNACRFCGKEIPSRQSLRGTLVAAAR
jgi:hypothetical protein